MFLLVPFLARPKFNRRNFIDIGMVCSLFVLMFVSVKSTIIFTYCYPFIGYKYFEDIYFSVKDRLKNKSIRIPKLSYNAPTVFISIFLAVIIGGCFFVFVGGKSFKKAVAISSEEYVSEDIIEYLKDNKPDRILNGYVTGNILLWNDIKVFQDSRQHPYIKEMGNEDAVDIYMKIRKDIDGSFTDEIFEKYDFDAVITNDELKINWYLQNSGKYKRVIDTKTSDLWILDTSASDTTSESM